MVQTCLVYAAGIENYTFEAQTTHLRLHYTTQTTSFRLRDSDKCDLVLFFWCNPIFDTATMFKRYVGPLMIRTHQVLQ